MACGRERIILDFNTMKKTLFFLAVIELLIIHVFKSVSIIGGQYGVNNNKNMVLEYGLSPVFIQGGSKYEGSICLARYGKVDVCQVSDTFYVENNYVQGMDGYLWDGNSLFILNHRKGELEYYRPELITDEKSGDEVVTFTKIPESEYPVFDIGYYYQTKGINRLCYHIIVVKWCLIVQMSIVLLIMTAVVYYNLRKRLKNRSPQTS